MIHYYEEFPDDFNEFARDFIAEFKYSFYFEDSDSVRLENEKTMLFFEISEVGTLAISISDKVNNKHYDMFWLNIFFGYELNENIFIKHKVFLEKEEQQMGMLRGSIRFDMKYEFEFLANYYSDILKGDFSWGDGYEKWIHWINNNWTPKSDKEEPPSYNEYIKIGS